MPSVGDKNAQILLSRGVVLSQSAFHLVININTDGLYCVIYIGPVCSAANDGSSPTSSSSNAMLYFTSQSRFYLLLF